MSQKQYLKTLETRLALINEKIDRKIIMGRTYKAEARIHRAIVRKLRAHKNPGFWDRFFAGSNRQYA